MNYGVETIRTPD